MKKPIRLKANDTVPDGMLITMHSGKLVAVYIAGRDDLNPNTMKAGTVIYANSATKARMDAAMAPTSH